MSTKDFKKVVRIGTSETYKDREFSIFCKIEFKNKKEVIKSKERKK